MATSNSADVQVVPGPEATWTGQKTQGIVSSRNHTIVYPRSGGEFVEGNKIRLEIPSQDYWDMSLFEISFQCLLSGGVGRKDGRQVNEPPTIFGGNQPGSEPTAVDESRWLTTKNGIQSLFNRVRILQGSTVIADVQSYGKLNRLLRIASVTPEHQKHIDFIKEGIYDPENWEQKKAARNFFASSDATVNNGHYFSVRLNTGFLEVDKYFPVKYTGQITFEIYLEQNQKCLRSSRTGPFSTGLIPSTPSLVAGKGPDVEATLDYPNPTYLIKDVQAHCHFVIPIQEYDEEMLSTIESQGLTVMFNTWSEHTRQIVGVGRSVHSFQERAVSVRGGLAVMENEHDLQGVENEFQFAANNIQEFQWKLGNTYVPSQPVQCQFGGGRALAELEDFLNITGDPTASWLLTDYTFLDTPATKTTANIIPSGTTIKNERRTYENWLEMRHGNSLPNQFIIALNLEKSPGQLSGFNTSATNVDIELRLNLGQQNNPSTKYADTKRDGKTWIDNQGTHVFQPSKYVCQDTTDGSTATMYYSGKQPYNKTYSGEGHGGMNYRAGDVNPIATGGTGTLSTTNYPSSLTLQMPPQSRFPGNIEQGLTSTSFLYTKEKHNFSQITFWANVDAQVNIVRIGQLEVLR